MAHPDALQPCPSPQFNPASDADPAAHDDRAPSRQTKASRRESRLGLRSIFGRSKAAKETDPLPHTIHGPRSMTVRASVANLGHWPDGHRSDATLPSSPPSWRHLPATPEVPQPGSVSQEAGAKEPRASSKPPKLSRNVVANWSMPPLFKAFPQAVRHVTLPAATMSADTILRLNEKRPGVGLSQEAALSVFSVDDDARQDAKDKDKRRHRRNASVSADTLEWTTKIYVLVTSGYVLQYAGDGHFDRLPEKILRLGPSSAAFATDAIPGRHWVLHVSSTAEADGTSMAGSRSILAKLHLRADRRNTSNLLMVFESGDVMEAWITTLRAEIEKLGGKRNLSETGRPKTDDEGLGHALRERRSQRTLVVRDASRFGRGGRGNGGPTRVASADTIRDQGLDDDSNSAVSQEERQLEHLRESSHRLSFISSGQPTVVTSSGSSPEASPTRESFSPPLPGGYANVVVRPRPNAHDIASRRQSVLVGGPFVDGGSNPGQARARRLPSGTSLRVDGPLSPLRPTPNFSVPHSSSRRFSHARAPLAELDGPLAHDGPYEAARPAQGARSPQGLRASRTLSMVMDLPLPPSREAAPERPATGCKGSRRASPTRWASQPHLRSASRGRERPHGDAMSRRPSMPVHLLDGRGGGSGTSARRMSSVDAIRRHEGASPRLGMDSAPGNCRKARDAARSPPPPPPPPVPGDDDSRYQTSFFDIGSPRSRSVEPSHRTGRATMRSELSELSMRSKGRNTVAFGPPKAAPPSGPLPRIPSHASSPYLKVDMTAKSLFNRRSMPQLTEGPPAPPPTRALPPIPRNPQLRA